MWKMEDEETIVTQYPLPATHTFVADGRTTSVADDKTSSVAEDRSNSAHNGGMIICNDFICFKFELVQCNTQECISRA